MPREVGRSCLTPLIGKRGGLAGDFTVTQLGPEEVWVLGGGAAERFHQRVFRAVPLPEGTTFERLTEAVRGFDLAGRRARELLARSTNAVLSNATFPFFRSRWIAVGRIDVVTIRVSFTGDLGGELHCAEADRPHTARRLARAKFDAVGLRLCNRVPAEEPAELGSRTGSEALEGCPCAQAARRALARKHALKQPKGR